MNIVCVCNKETSKLLKVGCAQKLSSPKDRKKPTEHCEIKGGLSGFNRLSQICSMFYQMLAASQNLLLTEENLTGNLKK